MSKYNWEDMTIYFFSIQFIYADIWLYLNQHVFLIEIK